jgi:hypothetical protein
MYEDDKFSENSNSDDEDDGFSDDDIPFGYKEVRKEDELPLYYTYPPKKWLHRNKLNIVKPTS